VSSNRCSFLPGLVLGGIGMAGVWTPVFSMATRNLQPRLAGVASGVLSTIQELGAVIGSAAIGAVLQNQLAADLHNRAVSYSAQDRKSTRLNSSHVSISYVVFCLKKKSRMLCARRLLLSRQSPATSNRRL